MDLIVDDPSALPGVVTEIPPNHQDAFIEYTYDLRGSGRDDEFACVHGHHRHLHGAVMRLGEARFLVGWMCAETIYGESLAGRRADYDAAVSRRHAIIRIGELREAITEFSMWADAVVKSKVLEAHDELRRQISSRFPFVFESLRDCGGRIGGVVMPRHLCAQYGNYLEDSFARLMKEIASVALALAGDHQRAMKSVGKIRSDIEGIIRRAEIAMARLADVELFFQPAVLSTICTAANNAVPRRATHYAGLLKLTCRSEVVEIPPSFALPDRKAIERLRAVLSG